MVARSNPGYGLLLLKRHADAAAGPPHDLAWPHRSLNPDSEMKRTWKANARRQFETRATIRKVSDRTVDDRLPLIEDDLADFQCAAARFDSIFRHDTYSYDRQAPSECRFEVRIVGGAWRIS